MSDIMERVLTMSVQAGAFILCILLITKLTEKHISPRLRYGLWLLPAIRLLIPVRFESALSLMSAASKRTHTLPLLPVVNAPVASPAPIVRPILSGASGETVAQAAPDLMTILFWVWLCGMAVVLAYMLYVNLRFYRRVRRERTPVDMEMRPPLYRMSGLSSPCLFGYFKPCILMNTQALKSEHIYQLVLRHELCHYRGGDQWWALLRNLCCIVHWFNPIVWWAAFRCRADCELSCDARVMKGFSQPECESYGMALLTIIHTNGKRKGVADMSTSMADGKREIKRRIRNIGDRPRTLRLAAALVLLLVLAAGLVACSEVQAEKSYAETLYGCKTEYIGNNSAVGRLLDAMDFPGGLNERSDGFALYTRNEPYAMTVRFTVENGQLESYEDAYETEFSLNAMTLFALIHNLDMLQFEISDGYKAILLQFSRQWADNMAGGSVAACGISVKTIEALLSTQPHYPITDDSTIDNEVTIVNTFEQTPSNLIEECHEKSEEVTSTTYYEMSDGTWKTDEYTYEYKLTITGRLSNAEIDITYTILSNTENISFEQAWKASGLSSNSADYFKPENAVFVASKLG
ncbi:MAG: M56 family metallopeptidase [Clostridia bacterium]